jgi:hypothetical protein
MIRSVPALALLAVLAVPALADDVVLSVDITQRPEESFEDAFAVFRASGATATSLSLFWDELEPRPGVYAPDYDWPTLANAFHAAEGVRLTLTFSVIDTVADRRRSDLTALAWDDPEVIAAFAAHLTEVLSRMPDVELLSVSVGNEIDGFLQTEAEIAAFARFLAAAKATVESLRPGVPVGTKITFGGLNRAPERWQPVIAASSALQVTYYPLTDGFAIRPDLDVGADLDRMIALAGGLPIFVLEAGYPSDGCGSQPDGQRRFVQDLIAGAEARAPEVRLVSLTWLTDVSAPEIEAYQTYYGTDDACFVRYLASLGLRGADGQAKDALIWLQER